MAEEKIVQVKESELNAILAELNQYREDGKQLAESIGALETRYQLFTVLSGLNGSNFIKIGNAIIQILRKMGADKEKHIVFDKIKAIAQKYAHLSKVG